jgi:hypothetical protein
VTSCGSTSGQNAANAAVTKSLWDGQGRSKAQCGGAPLFFEFADGAPCPRRDCFGATTTRRTPHVRCWSLCLGTRRVYRHRCLDLECDFEGLWVWLKAPRQPGPLAIWDNLRCTYPILIPYSRSVECDDFEMGNSANRWWKKYCFFICLSGNSLSGPPYLPCIGNNIKHMYILYTGCHHIHISLKLI